MKYEMNGRIRFSEVDRHKRITLPAVINYFQDLSTFQSEDLGMGFQHLESQHMAWMLSSWQIVIERRARFGEEIITATWATGFQGIYGTRNFSMTDAQGKRVAYANSIWVYMGLQTGRPGKPSEEQIRGYDIEPALKMEYAPRKIKPAKEYRIGQAFLVHRYHIDTNGHVNNSQYVQMALEVLPEDILTGQLRVEYKRAAVYGEAIVPKIAKEEGRTVIELCAEDGKPFAVVEIREDSSNSEGEDREIR